MAALRKTNRNDWTALQVQLARDRGATVAEVAGRLGCSARYIYKLSNWQKQGYWIKLFFLSIIGFVEQFLLQKFSG